MRERENIREIHLQRIVHLLANFECDAGRNRADDHVDLIESVIEILLYERAYFLRLQVVRVVVPGAERVRAEHDAPLDFGAEPIAARLAHHFPHLVAFLKAITVLDAVVARQVGGCLRRR